MATELSTVQGRSPSSLPDQPKNRILSSLPTAEFDQIARDLRPMPLAARQICHKQGEIIRSVYFPGGGACSLIKVMRDGRTSEVASIGAEGIIGAGVFFGDDVSHVDVIAQVRDPYAVGMPVYAFAAAMNQRGALYNRVARYSQTLAMQITQTAACNGLHSVRSRWCRWLLTTHDRVGGIDLTVTQDFVASMLGVRRPTVTLITAELAKAGLIRAHRGRITVLDRPGIEAASCECYDSIRSNFRRLLPDLTH